jgi:hypothetical protein
LEPSGDVSAEGAATITAERRFANAGGSRIFREKLAATFFVMPGLVPGIHVFAAL